MFILKIHVVDTREPPHTTSGDSSSANPSPKRTPIIMMGVAHLFRQLPSATYPVLTTAGTTRVFVVAVPNYLSENDFVVSCETHVRNFVDIIFLKNDDMQDRYSVLITLENQLAADEFYRSHNGKRFKPCEGEVCHIYFAESVQYTKSEEIATLPPPDYTELPSCPVCLERLGSEIGGIQSTSCHHSDHCSCVSKWMYKSCLVCRRLCLEKLECVVCRNLDNLWLCLICGFVACKRYVKGHASEHWQKKQHRFAVEVGRERIWDYYRDLYVGGKSYSNSTDEIVDLHTRRLMSEVEIQQQRVVNACIHSLTNELDNIMWIQAKLAISEVVRERTSLVEFDSLERLQSMEKGISQIMENEKKAVKDVEEMEKQKETTGKHLRETENQLQVMETLWKKIEKEKEDMRKKWQKAETEKKAAQRKCQKLEAEKQHLSDIMAKKSIQQEDEIEYLKASSSLLHEENINLRASNNHTEKENLRALNDYLLKEIHKVRSDLDAEKKLRELLEAEKKQRDSWESWD